MMKIHLYLLTLIILISCSNAEKPADDERDISAKIEEPSIGIEDSVPTHKADLQTQNENEDWLAPEFLTADFNNDKIADTAYAVVIGGKKGIRIKHGGKDEEFVIGAGRKFGNGGDDFYWVDSWRLVNDPITYNQTFAENGGVLGAEEVKLESTAFYIEKEEVGGATIAWVNVEYIWIHQAD